MARFGILKSLVTLLAAAVAVVPVAFAVPLDERAENLSPIAREILLGATAKRSVPAAPNFVTYSDRFYSETSLPPVSDVEGFTVYALAFIFPSSVQDNAAVWQGLSSATRASTLAEYSAAGISIVVSAFGSTSLPTSGGVDPTAAAQYIANFVIDYDLAGVDVDYEDFGAVETAGTAVAWLTTFTKALRAQLPVGQYILTHAPVAPWFSPNLWPDNGYLGVHAAVGSLIDWYNVQFYNQGTSEYTTCAGLLDTSSSAWPESALFQIAANGVELSKLVIGKPAQAGDASNGYMDPGTLAGCLETAKGQGWDGGVMTWQYPDGDSAWIEEVRADSWPVGSSTGGGGGTSTTTTTTHSTTSTTTTTTSSTSTSTSCAGVSAWVASAAYTSGSVVTYNGDLWKANQWNEDEVPGGSSGAWNESGVC
ncbi:Glycoside hydrolase family 18 protein [Mycena chlorophos]|uniref:Glycoside hydrolase family 18 protein n=1 Tax=Mycena chlorophos TaxID=658473 RepID=A0A8H6RW43_MYCCL|nr:Glycoside hydrolase family 18 protein [Mycena chlorophos]